MSRFHPKYHRKNHHTLPTIGYPDSATDPIASQSDPFEGDFWINGEIYVNGQSLSASGGGSVSIATETSYGTVELATVGEVNDPTHTEDQVARAKHLIPKKSGSALLFPDINGDYISENRGNGAIEFGRTPSLSSEGAIGTYSVNFGSGGTTGGYISTHFGLDGTVSDRYSVHFGRDGVIDGDGYNAHFGYRGTIGGDGLAYFNAHFGAGGTISGNYAVHFGWEGNIISGANGAHFGYGGIVRGNNAIHFGQEGDINGTSCAHFGYGGTLSNGAGGSTYNAIHFGANGNVIGWGATHFGQLGTVSGDYTTHFGTSGTVSGYYATHFGNSGNADKVTQTVFSGGKFVNNGDAQQSILTVRNATADSTPTELFIDGSSERLTISDNTTWFFEIDISARRFDVANESAAYKVQGCIDRNSGTVALVGVPVLTVFSEDSIAWDVDVSADDTNKALSVSVTGEAGKTIRWVGGVKLVEVSS